MKNKLLKESMLCIALAQSLIAFPAHYIDPIQDADVTLPESFTLRQQFNDAISQLSGKNFSRVLAYGDKNIVLVPSESTTEIASIYIIDGTKNEDVKTINTTGIITEGCEIPLSDIALTSDGKLIGCNMHKTAFDDTDNFVTIYIWDTMDCAPRIWTTIASSGNWGTALSGRTMAFAGTSDNGRLILSHERTGSFKLRFTFNEIVSGAWNTGTSKSKFDGDPLLGTDPTDGSDTTGKIILGKDYKFSISPRFDNGLIIDSKNVLPIIYYPMEPSYTYGEVQTLTLSTMDTFPEGTISPKASGANYFKYAGRALMVTPDVNDNGTIKTIKILDITAGFNRLSEVATNYNTSPSSDATNVNATISVDNADINIYALCGSNFAKYTTKQSVYVLNLTQTEFSIYPSPTSDILNISSSEPISTVEIYSANGSLVLQDKNSTINIESLSSGVYFVKVNNQNPIRIIKK